MNMNLLSPVTDQKHLEINKWWVERMDDGSSGVPVALGVIPHFCFKVNDGSSAITVLLDGVDITSDLTNVSLTSIQGQGMYAVFAGDYSGTATRGDHTLTVQVGLVNYYFNQFTWLPADCLLLVEGYHSERLNVDCDHSLLFDTFPTLRFRYWVEVGVLAKPNYEYERNVIEQEGIPYSINIRAWKEYQFESYELESTCDYLLLLPLLHVVTVSWNGKTYKPIQMIPIFDWVEEGDYCLVSWTFRTVSVASSFGNVQQLQIGAFDGGFDDGFN